MINESFIFNWIGTDVCFMHRQTEEMKRALEKVDNWSGNEDSEAYINEIVAKHFEDQNLLQVFFHTKLFSIKRTLNN